MKTPLRSHPLPAAACCLLLFAFAALPAGLHAQLPKIFVASFGNDANDGTRNAPKRNFQAAHDAVAMGGQIVVLDTAGYGALTITKRLAVTVPPGVNGFVTVSGTASAITVNAGTGEVSLRGLIIEGGGSRTANTPGSSYGINVLNVGLLTVEDCTIRNFFDGLFFHSGYSGTLPQLAVQNTVVRNCRYGIDVEATSTSASTEAAITGCRLENDGDAVYVRGTTGFGIVFAILEDTVLQLSDLGIHHNGNAGVSLSNCKVNYLTTFITKDGSGTVNTVLSYGNNTIVMSGSSNFDSTDPLR